MADPQSFMSRIASEFSDAISNPETPNNCPHCGKPRDDVQQPKKRDAQDFQKGMGFPSESGQ